MAEETIILKIEIDEGQKTVDQQVDDVKELDTSIKGLAASNKQLREERSRLDTQSVEGAKRIQELNKLIDKNNDIIKENSSNLEKQRLNVGNYQRGVTDALKEIRIGGVNVGDVLDKLQKANEDLFQGMQAGFQKSGLAAKLFGTTARTALTLSGIGILIAGIALLITHWDDLTKAIGLSTTALEDQKEKFDELNAATDHRIKLMQILGASERDINTVNLFNLRRQQIEEQKLLETEEKRAKGMKALSLGLINLTENQETLRVSIEARRKEIELLENREAIFASLGDNRAKEKTKTEKIETDNSLKIVNEARTLRLQLFDEEQARIAEALQKAHDDREALRQREIELIAAFNERIAKETKDRIDKQTKAANEAAAHERKIEDLKNEALIGGVHLVTKEKTTARVLLSTLFQADAISETFINTHAAAVAAFKSLAGIPIIGPVLGAAAAAAVTIFGLANVAQIAGISFEGFAEGGISGKRITEHDGKSIQRRSNGDNLLATVRTGEVILNEDQQRKLGGAKTFAAIGVPGFQSGGITSSALEFQTRAVASQVETTRMLQRIAVLIERQPRQVLVLQDFESVQEARDTVETRATI